MPLTTTLCSMLMLGLAPAGGGGIHGTVIDDRDFLPRRDVTINLTCDCEMEARTQRSSPRGTFHFEGLKPGRYQLELFGGEGVIHYEYEVGPDQTRELVLAIPRGRLPPRDTRNLPVYSGYSRQRQLLGAQLELSVGGVLLAAGALMIMGGAVETAKPDCLLGGDCADPPRPRVARGLILGGGLSATVGAVLLGLGSAHLRRYRLGVQVSERGGTISLTGRF